MNRFAVPAALIGSAFAGMLVAVQSRVNGGLSQELGSGYVAAAVSFGSGLVILIVATLISRRARRGLGELRSLVAQGSFPWWALFGGVFGALFVLAQGLVASVLGLALFTVGIVAGQVAGGLIIDRIGLGPGGKVPLTLQRVVGTLIALVAVGISVGGDLGANNAAWLVVFPLLAGFGVALQSATNGLVRSAARSAIAATLLNFIVGFTVLAIFCAVSVAVQGWPEVWPTHPLYYIGGAIGVFFIALASVLVRVAGVLLLSMSNIAGQLVAAVLLDLGLPLAGGVTWAMAVGAAVALVAVVVAAIPSRATGS